MPRTTLRREANLAKACAGASSMEAVESGILAGANNHNRLVMPLVKWWCEARPASIDPSYACGLAVPRFGEWNCGPAADVQMP